MSFNKLMITPINPINNLIFKNWSSLPLINSIISFLKLVITPFNHFSNLIFKIGYYSNFKYNLIDDCYNQNQCFNSITCYVCKKIEESKDDFTKKRLKRLNRVKDMRQNVRELKRCFIMPVLRRTYILFTTLIAYLFFQYQK